MQTINPPSQSFLMKSPETLVGLPVGRVSRAALAGLALALACGFLAAAWLQPDPQGFGTHRQFGLPGCSFRMLFGKPCPGCGMTTCFANFVRGDWNAAARANPAGLLLATVCAGLIPWSLISAWSGRLLWVSHPLPLAAVLAGSVGVTTLTVWWMRL